ncbi:MAG: hypothetical protein GX633_07295, partial [Clostridiales bacterium]|nr:hypothetical protein [Clostridiales bacterium]
MKRKTIAAISLLLTVLIIMATFSGCNFAGKKKDIEEQIVPDVTEEMYSAAYWLKSVKEADKLIMTASDIAQFNKQITAQQTSG